jgi:hypothetical protein
MSTNITLQRLLNQRLLDIKFQTAGEVVAWMGAVQGQEYALAKWALAQRMERATDEVIEQAFAKGEILRTHVMRPTWHFVMPDDIRWILELTAPRVHAVSAYMYRQLELDNSLFTRSREAIARTLQGGKHLTRAEIGAVLAEIGIDTSNGMRLGYIVFDAELERIVCSGPRRGKQHTYALLDERAPQARSLPRDEALVELTKRYFTSHGPATVQDFAWWSGLTVADGKAGLAMLGSQLINEEIAGKAYWFSPATPAINEIRLTVQLLPVYDEYGIAYKDRSALLDPAYTEQPEDRFFVSPLVVNGRVAGMWRRTFSKGTVVIDTKLYRPLTAAENNAFVDAARCYGEFLGMSVKITE